MVEMAGIAPASERHFRHLRYKLGLSCPLGECRMTSEWTGVGVMPSFQPSPPKVETPIGASPGDDDRSTASGHRCGDRPVQFALGEGRSKGWNCESRSERVLHLRHDVGNCHFDGVDLRAAPSRTACRCGKGPSSMLIHPRI